MADNLDYFLPNILTQDTKKKIQIYEEIVAYLRSPNASVKCEDFDKFLDGVAGWIVASNFKISLNGLEVLMCLMDIMKNNFQSYIPTFLPLIVDRLGDNKEPVRNSAQDLLSKLMSVVASPQVIFEKLLFAFSHKSPKVKEELLICIQKTLNEYGTSRNMGISKLVPHIIKLLDDPSVPIRELSVDTLVVIYQYAGDKLRNDIIKKDINQNKLNQLLMRFDEMKNTGLLSCDDGIRKSDDELDKASTSSPIASSSSSLVQEEQKTTATTTSKSSTPKRQLSSTGLDRKMSLGNSNPVGVDEESFVKQFTQVPKINIYSSKDFVDRMTKVKDVLNDQNADWSKRVEALKEVRAWLLPPPSPQNYDVKGGTEFMANLVTFEPLFHASVRDLRSQVVRESCITIAFLSQELTKDFGHFAETILPPLFILIPNSARVMATSATVAIRFVLKNTQNHKLIPIVASNLSSKSNIIRKQTCEFMNDILQDWSTSVIEKQTPVILDFIKKGVSDADADARMHSRRAFWSFSENFKQQADALLSSLEVSRQKQLMGEAQATSSSSSLVDLNEAVKPTTNKNVPSAKTGRRFSGASTNQEKASVASSGYGRKVSKERNGHATSDLDLSSLSDKMCKIGIGGSINRSQQAIYGTLRKTSGYSTTSMSSSSKHSQASNSLTNSSLTTSCDEQTLSASLKLARSRKTPSGKPMSNLPTPTSITSSGYSSSINSSIMDRGRSRSKIGVSQSQPTSRSNSPSPRLSYITPIQPDVVPTTTPLFNNYINRRRSTTTLSNNSNNIGNNRSRDSSRDSSPNRSYVSGRDRKASGQSGSIRSRSKLSGGGGGGGGGMLRSTPGDEFLSSRFKPSSSSCDNDDNNSETSSVCSDGSSYWNAAKQIIEDPSDIITCLSSGSWSDRRDGLIALQHLINNNRSLSRLELKRITDIFSRMFHDPHGKVFSIFLDTLTLFVSSYYSQLSDWLYVLLTRLLSKSGADLLGSTQVKVQRSLDAVRTTFSTSQQFTLLSKFLIDQTQSPNIKVKVSMLLYLHNLTQLMDASDFSNTSDVRLAISRIITWTTEPKSVDVRKASQAVLLSLHALNPLEFQVIMSVLPKTFQEGAERILQSRHHHHHHHSGQSSESQSLKDPLSPVSGGSGGGGCGGFNFSPSPVVGHQPLLTTSAAAATTSSSSTTSSSTLTTNATATTMNADDVYNSIRQTSQDIHSFVHQPPPHHPHHHHHHLPVKSISLASTRTLPTTLSIESRIPSFLQNLPDVDIVAKMAAGAGRDGRECNGAIQSWFGVSNVIKKEREEAEKTSDQTTMMSVASILQVLSHHNEQNDQRKSCLLQLMKRCREETMETWDEYFDTTLLVLLETLTDVDGSIRALSLRVLSEFLRCHAERFHEYVELTVVRSLEAHKDPVKEVTRAAEECSNLLSRIIPPSRTHTILSPLIESDDYPINLAAIKMVNQIVEEADMGVVVDILPYITPSLLKAYENQQSSVRKSSVVCLVAIYMSVGEQLRPYLQDLHGSKVKLLNVYIKRALDQQGASSCATSKTSSPTSVVEA